MAVPRSSPSPDFQAVLSAHPDRLRLWLHPLKDAGLDWSEMHQQIKREFNITCALPQTNRNAASPSRFLCRCEGGKESGSDLLLTQDVRIFLDFSCSRTYWLSNKPIPARNYLCCATKPSPGCATGNRPRATEVSQTLGHQSQGSNAARRPSRRPPSRQTGAAMPKSALQPRRRAARPSASGFGQTCA